MTQSAKIVFFGNERLSSGFDPEGAPTLEALLANGYNIAAVVANFEPGQSRNPRQLEIQKVATRHNIPVLLPQKLTDITHQLTNSHADAAVLVAYGKIIPQSIIDIFPRGIINIHPSLLPQYRGPTPIEQAILDGATQTGVSLMQLVKQMDAGPLFAQAAVPLNGTETKQALTKKLLTLGGQLLIKHLPSILEGSAAPRPQDESRATFTKLFTKEDGRLNTAHSAEELERMIRAYAVWPKSRLHIFEQTVIVLEARTARSSSEGGLIVPCGNGTLLEIIRLIAPSGRTMTGADFKRGYLKTA